MLHQRANWLSRIGAEFGMKKVARADCGLIEQDCVLNFMVCFHKVVSCALKGLRASLSIFSGLIFHLYRWFEISDSLPSRMIPYKAK